MVHSSARCPPPSFGVFLRSFKEVAIVVDGGLFYFMASISEIVYFTSEEDEKLELIVLSDGSVQITSFEFMSTGNGVMITISREDWAVISKFVKRQQKNI